MVLGKNFTTEMLVEQNPPENIPLSMYPFRKLDSESYIA